MKVVALAGGVGGAKLADGLARILHPSDLVIVVNTGDDFEHLGLKISPDLDTVCYTLAGFANPDTGWGRSGESYRVLSTVRQLGGPDWFKLGDLDLATHLERTRRLEAGQPLSQITQNFCLIWAIKPTVLPMSDQPVRTIILTRESGELPFQEYFVHLKCEPQVNGFRFLGIESALPTPGVLEAIKAADAVVICPSNPWVSIDPILNLVGIRSALLEKCVVAVSPIVGSASLKGPAAKMFTEMGIQPSALAVTRHYGNLLTAFILDRSDAGLTDEISIPYLCTDIIMKTLTDRQRLAEDVLNLVKSL